MNLRKNNFEELKAMLLSANFDDVVLALRIGTKTQIENICKLMNGGESRYLILKFEPSNEHIIIKTLEANYCISSTPALHIWEPQRTSEFDKFNFKVIDFT